MPGRIRARLTFANVVSLIALFVALGGGAYAVVRVPRNAVGTKQLKNRAVTTKKLANGAVTGAKADVSRFPTVPSAFHAARATDAATVGHKQVRQFFFKGGASSGPTTVLRVDGFAIKAGCDAAKKPLATIENDSGTAAEVHGLVASDAGPPGLAPISSSDFGAAGEDMTGGYAAGSGHLTAAATDGTTVSVVYGFDDSATFGDEDVCTVNGSVVAG